MSYRCDECGATAPQKQQLIKSFTYRKKEYHNRTYNEKKRITTGHEIASEQKLCKKCAEKGVEHEE
jgi:DNA-directed RNA polymerase subunit M/transcription elongation factor TFIIS